MATGAHRLTIDVVDQTAGVFAHCSCGHWQIKAARNRAEVRIHRGTHLDSVTNDALDAIAEQENSNA